jgi:hypothetical protein
MRLTSIIFLSHLREIILHRIINSKIIFMIIVGRLIQWRFIIYIASVA